MFRNIPFDSLITCMKGVFFFFFFFFFVCLFLAIRVCEHKPCNIRADRFIQSRLHHRSHCLFILHSRYFVDNTGISVHVPLTSCWFATGQPTPQVNQTRSYTFTNFPLCRKQVKRLEDCMTFSFYRKFTSQKQISSTNDDPTFLVYCLSRSIQSRTCSGRRT